MSVQPISKPWETNSAPLAPPTTDNNSVAQNDTYMWPSYGAPSPYYANLNNNRYSSYMSPSFALSPSYYNPNCPTKFGFPLMAKANGMLDGLAQFIQAIEGLTTFLNSSIYALGSSISAFSTASQNMLYLKDECYIRVCGLFERVKSIVRRIAAWLTHTTSHKTFWNRTTNASQIRSRTIRLVVKVATALGVSLFVLQAIRSFVSRRHYQVGRVLFDLDTPHMDVLKAKRDEEIKISFVDGNHAWLLGVKSTGERGFIPRNYVTIN